MRASERLRKLAKEIEAMEIELDAEDGQKQETMNRYYYGKGALDYRDKIIAKIGKLSKDASAVTALEDILSTFPDPYPGK